MKTATTRSLSPRAAVPMRSPMPARQRAERLAGQRDELRRRLSRLEKNLAATNACLELSTPVTEALRILGEKLFEQVLGGLQSRLTIALQDVLQQPIEFHAAADFKRGSAIVDFSIRRDGNAEDIRRGQGGSVQNILSVGLRMFALASLDPGQHRRFLVLDEQDCWLHPDLVPRLVKIVSQAARELEFQVLMISHHDIGLFEGYADRVFRLCPDGSRVAVQEYCPSAGTPDWIPEARASSCGRTGDP